MGTRGQTCGFAFWHAGIHFAALARRRCLDGLIPDLTDGRLRGTLRFLALNCGVAATFANCTHVRIPRVAGQVTLLGIEIYVFSRAFHEHSPRFKFSLKFTTTTLTLSSHALHSASFKHFALCRTVPAGQKQPSLVGPLQMDLNFAMFAGSFKAVDAFIIFSLSSIVLHVSAQPHGLYT